MNCPSCNSELASGAKYCPKCGSSIPDPMESSPKSAGGSLIAALLIFLFVAGGGVIGYLYFFAEPKRTEPENKIINDPASAKPVDKDQEVPMPDAGSSQSSPPQKQEIPKPEVEPPQPQNQEVPEPKDEKTSNPASQDTETSDPMRITADVVQPELTHRVNPEYPEIARKARIQGVVILEAIITKDGTVENVKVLRGVHPILDQAAINSVKQWRYKPATLNGSPVKVYSTVTVKFTLKK
ncbi:TonB family protein [bacterium]|nr:TonB family protein [bacterium]